MRGSRWRRWRRGGGGGGGGGSGDDRSKREGGRRTGPLFAEILLSRRSALPRSHTETPQSWPWWMTLERTHAIAQLLVGHVEKESLA